MTREEAKQILMLYRPDRPEEDDPGLRQALALAEKDPDLGAWLKNHLESQQSLRRAFRSLPAPADLPDQILAAQKVVQPPLWRKSSALWLAAALVLFLGLISRILLSDPAPDRFQNFQQRMVSSVLREYRMDITTNHVEAVRQYMEQHAAPSTFEVPAGLQKLTLTGGGLLRWRNHPVSMICYDRGTNEMVFLFVMNRQAPRDPPPTTPAFQQVNKLTTASWTRGDWTYFMAAKKSPEFPENYLPERVE